MRFLDPLRNRYLARPFLINSLPRAGTHLLLNVVRFFPGIEAEAQLDLVRLRSEGSRTPPIPDTVPLGVGAPLHVPVNVVRDALERIRRGRFAVGHVPFSEAMAALLSQRNMRSVLILRDPRDVVVSFTEYVSSETDHDLHERFAAMAADERLATAIIGLLDGDGESILLGIDERCRSLLRWTQDPMNLTTTFERLVGPRGGGSGETQRTDIARIGSHLGLSYGSQDVDRIADRAFGDSFMFRKGLIGGWRDHFTPDHVRLFKDVAARTLIEMGYERDDNW